MAGGGNANSRSLEQTPTWVVAIVCLGFVLISILIEQAIHFLSKWECRMKSLGQALEKIKGELMLLGFFSLLLTVGQKPISEICISKSLGDSLLPYSKEEVLEDNAFDEIEKFSLFGCHGKLLFLEASETPLRRSLATYETVTSRCAKNGKVPLISQDGLHQLHIFIFVLAVFHVMSCFVIMILGSAKVKKWKSWEEETATLDPSHKTTFGWIMSFCSTTPILNWIVYFFKQFVSRKADYINLCHAFEHASFDQHNKLKRSLDNYFSVLVSIRVVHLLLTTIYSIHYSSDSGNKDSSHNNKNGKKLDSQDRNPIVRGAAVVKLLFWFGKPRLTLHLIHFTLFQYKYGLKSCFHKWVQDIVARLSLGIGVQILCSYVTLPLYALVTQPGTNMEDLSSTRPTPTEGSSPHHFYHSHNNPSDKKGRN